MEVIFLDIKQIERTLTKEFSKSLRDKTIKAIKDASIEELTELKGITKPLAEKIKQALNKMS